jgi:hypothetical protein
MPPPAPPRAHACARKAISLQILSHTAINTLISENIWSRVFWPRESKKQKLTHLGQCSSMTLMYPPPHMTDMFHTLGTKRQRDTHTILGLFRHDTRSLSTRYWVAVDTLSSLSTRTDQKKDQSDAHLITRITHGTLLGLFPHNIRSLSTRCWVSFDTLRSLSTRYQASMCVCAVCLRVR